MKPIFSLFGASIDVLLLNIVFAIPVYFLVRQRIKSFIYHMYQTRVALLATFVLTPFLFIGTIVGLEEVKTHFPDSAFVKTARAMKHQLMETTSSIN